MEDRKDPKMDAEMSAAKETGKLEDEEMKDLSTCPDSEASPSEKTSGTIMAGNKVAKGSVNLVTPGAGSSAAESSAHADAKRAAKDSTWCIRLMEGEGLHAAHL